MNRRKKEKPYFIVRILSWIVCSLLLCVCVSFVCLFDIFNLISTEFYAYLRYTFIIISCWPQNVNLCLILIDFCFLFFGFLWKIVIKVKWIGRFLLGKSVHFYIFSCIFFHRGHAQRTINTNYFLRNNFRKMLWNVPIHFQFHVWKHCMRYNSKNRIVPPCSHSKYLQLFSFWVSIGKYNNE